MTLSTGMIGYLRGPDGLFGISRFGPERNRSLFGHTINPDQACSVKIARNWPCSLLGISHFGPARNSSLFGHIVSPLLTKLVSARKPEIGLLVYVFIDHDFSVDKHAKKNFADSQLP